jgi:ribulose-phosphate 3-epimerase
MKVIPVLNCQDIACIREKIEVAKTFLPEGSLLHLDVIDGSFATHKTWADPTEWAALKSPFALEVHLMVEQPEQYADNWLSAGAKRLIVHVETIRAQSLHELVDTAKRYNAEVMLSSKPESGFEEMDAYVKRFHLFQVLAVQPGPAGQKFLSFVTEKIRFLREEHPSATIEVDGGINGETAKLVKGFGADTIVSSSYIFGSADPKKAYDELVAI